MLDLNVNKQLLPMKGHYFLYNAAAAPVIPFMSVYARQLGFSSFVVGIIYTVLPFSGMLAKPAMGMVADRYKCQKIIFLISQLIVAVGFLFMIFLPMVPNMKGKIHFSCNDGEAAMDSCGHAEDFIIKHKYENLNNIEALCYMNCMLETKQWDVIKYWNGSDDIVNSHKKALSFTAHVPMNLTDQLNSCIYFKVNNVTLTNKKTMYPLCPQFHKLSVICDIECNNKALNDVVAVEDEDYSFVHQYQFWILLTLYLIIWISQAVVVSIGDTICFQLLGNQPYKYGYQRMYGALGWGIFSIIAGALVDAFSKQSDYKNYAPVFSIGIVIMLMCIAVSYQIKYVQPNISTNILRDIGQVLTNIHIFIFVLWCLCMGLCTALMWNFLFWLLEDLAAKQGPDTQAWIKTIEGLVMGIQCLGGELPFFFLSSWILKRIKHINAMSLILVATGIRFMLYSIISNPWQALPIEFLNGITFGLFYATMASYASIIAPPGTEATTQGLVGAIFEGIGVSLGSFVGGLLFEQGGGSWTFRIFGIFALSACLLHVLVQLLLQRIANKDKGSWALYATPQDAIDIMDEY